MDKNITANHYSQQEREKFKQRVLRAMEEFSKMPREKLRTPAADAEVGAVLTTEFGKVASAMLTICRKLVLAGYKPEAHDRSALVALNAKLPLKASSIVERKSYTRFKTADSMPLGSEEVKRISKERHKTASTERWKRNAKKNQEHVQVTPPNVSQDYLRRLHAVVMEGAEMYNISDAHFSVDAQGQVWKDIHYRLKDSGPIGFIGKGPVKLPKKRC